MPLIFFENLFDGAIYVTHTKSSDSSLSYTVYVDWTRRRSVCPWAALEVLFNLPVLTQHTRKKRKPQNQLLPDIDHSLSPTLLLLFLYIILPFLLVVLYLCSLLLFDDLKPKHPPLFCHSHQIKLRSEKHSRSYIV